MILPKIRLEARSKLFLGVTGGLLALVWIVRFLYLPVLSRLGAARAALRDLTVKIGDAQGLTQQLPAQRAALEQARGAYKAMYGRVGDGQSVARILEELSEEAKGQRLELVAVQPRSSEEEQGVLVVGPDLALREVALTLQLKGRYQQMGEFLSRFPEAPFLASVRTLRMRKPQADSAQLEAELDLVVYLVDRPAKL